MFSPSAAAAKSLQSCPTLCDPIDSSPTRLPCPWDSQGKNTGVGCHFLLQCMKAKTESEVAQSWPTLSDLMDCSPPGSSIHGIFQARVLEWGAIAFLWSHGWKNPIQCPVTTRGVGWYGRWEGGSGEGAQVYPYGWFMLMYGGNQHNIGKQLSPNEK